MRTFSGRIEVLGLALTLLSTTLVRAEHLRSAPDTVTKACDDGVPCLCKVNQEQWTKVVLSCNASTEIRLNNLDIIAIDPHALDNMPQLRSLEVSGNTLTEFPKQLLAHKPNLENLDISGNNLTKCAEDLFSGISTLQYLAIGENPIDSIPENLLSNLPNLQTLRLNSLMLSSLPENVFKNQRNLRSLLLTGNSLTSLPVTLFSSLSGAIENIDISSNKLKMLEKGTFDGLAKLRLLDVHTNKLTTLPKGLFKDNIGLKTLDMSSNLLEMLPENIFSSLRISGQKYYSFLTLTTNNLTTLPEGIFSTIDADLIKLCEAFQVSNHGCLQAYCPEDSTYEPIKASAEQKFCTTKTYV